MNATMTRTKAAVIRRGGFPIGQPAPCFIRCCGNEIDVPQYGQDEYTNTVACPTCKAEYTQGGNLIPERRHYVQIVRQPAEFEHDNWIPWKLGDSKPTLEQTALLALGKWMREGGYTDPRAEYEPFEVMVYVADSRSPRHPNGRFMVCEGFKVRVSKR